MKNLFKTTLLLFTIALFTSCKQETVATQNEYFAQSSDSIQNGGVKVIPITTPKGTFNVWTKRIGNNPKIKVLLLNGGPGATHEYFECFENFLPAEGIEFIYYDQLGCGNADNPNDTSMWDLPRYVEEVEQVRKALKLDNTNFYLLGHSWGGILAMEYAVKYQNNMKGLIISNMMASCPEYGKYADEVLSKQLAPEVLKEIRDIEARKDFSNPRYMELLIPNFYEKHVLRFPSKDWPEPVNRSLGKTNQSLYVTMQGPSEFGIAGKLEKWDRKADLKNVNIPTLVIGAKHDTMDPKHMEEISKILPKGSYLFCPKGSHMAFYDDQKTYFSGLISFLKK
ncbi:proline iminopeptidase-family hydrolase [Flavobacterium lacisediminis]|uniref:Proline iminopeptidase-family hydrolase n=1 Tax=Flavobacterium lacisediminis TaxID=2989705 RepID=A0ABT3EIP9_9FLAO|nr:proline iminopeptidase-family hydrolase [Flavobacterium lacisediminis]MCW1148455.1 proline iminopeptidase-family hydrolase [Flavobacterium lacisediminis]